MQIDIGQAEDITIITLSGDLDGSSAAETRLRLRPTLQTGGKILLDLAGVTYISSAGLQMLLSSHRLVSQSGGRLALVVTLASVLEVLEITGFQSFFTICSTREEAIKALTL